MGNRLGIHESRISQLVNQKYIKPTELAQLFKNAITGGENHALSFPIKPIIEYYPCKPTPTTHGKKYDVFNKKNKIGKGLADVLKNYRGIYLFYDSQYQSLYIGKTESKNRNLLDEMKDAFNRKREKQKAYRVKHDGYTNKSEFVPAFSHPNKIVESNVYLYEIAKYFSAYWVDERLVNDIEALLIRCFANDVSNVRMERFAGSRNI